MMNAAQKPQNPSLLTIALLIGLITALRLAALFITDLNIGPDEAQYWSWSQDLSFGYFSKPPMIAWAIALTTSLGGESEAVIRLSSPLLHFATSLVVFVLARDLQGARIAFWAALTYATLPAIWFSSGLMSTDVLLLFFWSVALLALHRVLSTRSTAWALILGFSLGLGFLSKYAMAYFIMGAGVLFIVSPDTRWFATSKFALIGLSIMAAIITPNIMWNLTHDLSTVSHTMANANWRGEMFNVGALMEFILGQAGIMGPLLFISFLWAVFAFLKGRKVNTTSADNLFLLSFTLPILVLVAVQSFISRANANWAATAYIGATLFIVIWLIKRSNKWVIPASLTVHALAGIGLIVLSANLSVIEATGLSNAFKRVRGWNEIGTEITDIASQGGYRTILSDNRLVMAELLYYARPRTQTIFIWDHDEIPQNHYEMNAAFDENAEGPILLASRTPTPKSILNSFNHVEKLEPLVTRTGVNKERVLYLYKLDGFHGR